MLVSEGLVMWSVNTAPRIALRLRTGSLPHSYYLVQVQHNALNVIRDAFYGLRNFSYLPNWMMDADMRVDL